MKVSDELLRKLPPTFLEDKAPSFTAKLLCRIERGKREYPLEYRFDPLDEIQEECLDIAVYAMIEYYRVQGLKERINGLGSTEG